MRARERVARGWCQGALFSAGGAASACLLGSLIETVGAQCNAEVIRLEALIGGGVVPWNDAPERTQQDVLDLLDVAIAEVDFEAESVPEPAVERVAA